MRILKLEPARITDRKVRKSSGASQADLDVDTPAAVVSIGRAATWARAAVDRLPSAVAARLESVRDQLRQGSYRIDYARLAHRLVEEEL
jgi:anti-sigma28 factor (negative regulator of flagellin synthesis)